MKQGVLQIAAEFEAAHLLGSGGHTPGDVEHRWDTMGHSRRRQVWCGKAGAVGVAPVDGPGLELLHKRMTGDVRQTMIDFGYIEKPIIVDQALKSMELDLF